MSCLRHWIKAVLPYPLVCAVARAINQPFLADVQRSERLTEYAWVLHQVRGPLIADVGYAGSYFAEMLCQVGRVVGIDPRDTPQIAHPNFTRVWPFSWETTGGFSTIVCISVLEHLPREEANRLVSQMTHALAPGGRLLITTPTGHEAPFRGYAPFTRSELDAWGGHVTVVRRRPGENQEHDVATVALVRITRPTIPLPSGEPSGPVPDSS